MFGPEALILGQEVGQSSGCKIKFTFGAMQHLVKEASKGWKRRKESTEYVVNLATIHDPLSISLGI